MSTTPRYILALDLGTTGNRAILFNAAGERVAQAYRELTQYYPQPGWLEHDPQQIWQDTRWAMQTVLQQAGVEARAIAAVGLAVQRETCLLWDSTTGQPLHNAIVWQDRRTADLCHQLTVAGHAQEISQRTGLVLDAYFSATKLAWLRQHLQLPASEQIRAGTIDSWILWQLTGGKLHATDHSNASRTLLLNLADRQWDPTLLALFDIPRHWLPEIHPSLGYFGCIDPDLLGAEIPITAVLGDQQAALFAHGCDHPGLLKCTYGTGCFLVAHTGTDIVRSPHKLLSTVAWTQGSKTSPEVGYALEGSMFTAGACIQWLRDGLQLITTAAETDTLARQVPDSGDVYFVPALSGLGAPHWDMQARGAFLGLTGGVQRNHLIRSVLEAIAYQVQEVVQAVNEDSSSSIQALKVDGGLCQNDFLLQFQADTLGIPIERPAMLDATAQGAAFAAGLTVGFWRDYEALVASRPLDRIFEPGAGADQAQARFPTWQRAVARAKQWAD
jgi:glycerol kinase